MGVSLVKIFVKTNIYIYMPPQKIIGTNTYASQLSVSVEEMLIGW